EALPALPAQAQPHAVGGAPGDARLDRPGRVAQPALGVDLGHVEAEVHLRARIRILEAQVHRGLEILAGNLHRRSRAARTSIPAAQALEEVAQVEVLERG